MDFFHGLHFLEGVQLIMIDQMLQLNDVYYFEFFCSIRLCHYFRVNLQMIFNSASKNA